jgi:DNA-binding transcriptional ArsR family regulator
MRDVRPLTSHLLLTMMNISLYWNIVMDYETINPDMIQCVVERFSALADPTRIRLLLLLKRGPSNVNALTAEVGISQASISKHLAILKSVGIVTASRKGTQSIYQIHDPTIFDLCKLVCNGVMNHAKEVHAALLADSI